MAAAALAPELLVQLDPGRFRADNLLGAEDWGEAGAWGGARGVGEGGEGAGRDAGGGEGAISRGKGGGVCGGAWSHLLITSGAWSVRVWLQRRGLLRGVFALGGA